VHFFGIALNVKMASEGTFEPCEKGTNEPVVQRSLSILFDVSSLNITALKISKSQIRLFYQEGKALSGVMEHHIGLRRASRNNID